METLLLGRAWGNTSLRDLTAHSREEIAKNILSYFLRRPDVADSFNGIARWRLLEDAVDRNVAATEEALVWLIDQGFLTEEPIAGSQSVFRLSSEKRSEAESLVRGERNPGSGRGKKKRG
jgi:hypothetical protein